jgi:hypothetical protein
MEKRRLIPIAPNLAEWLRPHASMTGPLWEKDFRTYHVTIRNLAAETGLARWPNNGLRHLFASYHLAKHQNAPQLALEMGHSTPRMVFDNYREVVAPEEAERYWVIRPNVIADNGVRLSPPYEPQLRVLIKNVGRSQPGDVMGNTSAVFGPSGYGPHEPNRVSRSSTRKGWLALATSANGHTEDRGAFKSTIGIATVSGNAPVLAISRASICSTSSR